MGRYSRGRLGFEGRQSTVEFLCVAEKAGGRDAGPPCPMLRAATNLSLDLEGPRLNAQDRPVLELSAARARVASIMARPSAGPHLWDAFGVIKITRRWTTGRPSSSYLRQTQPRYRVSGELAIATPTSSRLSNTPYTYMSLFIWSG